MVFFLTFLVFVIASIVYTRVFLCGASFYILLSTLSAFIIGTSWTSDAPLWARIVVTVMAGWPFAVMVADLVKAWSCCVEERRVAVAVRQFLRHQGVPDELAVEMLRRPMVVLGASEKEAASIAGLRSVYPGGTDPKTCWPEWSRAHVVAAGSLSEQPSPISARRVLVAVFQNGRIAHVAEAQGIGGKWKRYNILWVSSGC